jgi:hypothetical protein
MTTGGTSPNYTLTMTMPTITNSLGPFSVCEQGCDSVGPQIVNFINTQSTGTSNNTDGYLTTNVGSRYEIPFHYNWYASYGVQSGKYSGSPIEGRIIINNSLNSTIPFSGNNSPYVLLPSLSSQTCDFSSVGELVNPGNQIQNTTIYVYDYITVMINPPDLTAFSIKTNPIVNGVRTSTDYSVTALTYSGGTVTYFDPLYTY